MTSYEETEKRLLAAVGLRNEQVVDVDTEFLRVEPVEGMLRIDESRNATHLLSLGNRMNGQRRLTRRLRSVNLDNSSSREASRSKCNVHRKGTGRNHLNILVHTGVPQLHDGALSAILLYLS